MKIVKALIWIGGLCVLACAIWWQSFGREQVAYVQISTAYATKKVCSCRFIAKRSMQSCLLDFPQDISQLTFQERGHIINGMAPLGLAKASARYRPGLGCSLIKRHAVIVE